MPDARDSGTLGRGATMEIAQMPNGYWHAEVVVRIPWVPDQFFECDALHDADEALEFVRQSIHSAVGNASHRQGSVSPRAVRYTSIGYMG